VCHHRFRVFASLMHRRRSTEVNQTLHDVWPSPALVHYIYIFGGSCLVTEFCQVHISPCVQVLRSPILASLLHSTRALGRQPNFAAWYKRNGTTELSLLVIFNRGRHLYSEGGHHVGHMLIFYFFLFLAYFQRSEIGCLPYFHR